MLNYFSQLLNSSISFEILLCLLAAREILNLRNHEKETDIFQSKIIISMTSSDVKRFTRPVR